MERYRLLLVIDNAESLLTESGEWRDDRWGRVLSALTAHSDVGRVIVTSRRVPADAVRLHAEAVDALSADEALLLAHELPNLHKLSQGEIPGVPGHVARRLALRVLNSPKVTPSC